MSKPAQAPAGLDGDAARVRSLLLAADQEGARALAAELVGEAFGLPVTSVAFTLDEYSLNSVSGRATLADGTARFFKFHAEEGEAGHVSEYYRGELLAAAGLPVELPVAVSTVPGRQMALYELRTEPRLADLCLDLERSGGATARLSDHLLAARRDLDATTGQVMLATLRPPAAASAGAAIHQLFHRRLVDPDGTFPGGRYRSWYTGHPDLARLTASRWRVNGIRYRSTLAELAARATSLLDPRALSALSVVTAHGDDHQGNIWVLNPGAGASRLRLFDPAFAGTDIPALLAPVKATFHNALAHPYWLYHPADAARSQIRVTVSDDEVSVEDDAAVSPLRYDILDSVADLVWRPLLAALAAHGRLPVNWRAIVRAGLFACPMLVTNLIAPHRPEPVRFLALSRAVMAGSEPDAGRDVVTDFLDRITP